MAEKGSRPASSKLSSKLGSALASALPSNLASNLASNLGSKLGSNEGSQLPSRLGSARRRATVAVVASEALERERSPERHASPERRLTDVADSLSELVDEQEVAQEQPRGSSISNLVGCTTSNGHSASGALA